MPPVKQLIVNANLLTFAGPVGPRAGKEMDSVGLVRGGALLMDAGKIVAAGSPEFVLGHPDAKKGLIRDAGGKVLMPGFVDSHTHPVFAAPRLRDFELRVRGKSYEEIAAAGGGIVASVAGVRGATERELSERLVARGKAFIACGTTTIEAKTGYGLDKDSELKALRAMRHANAGGPLELIPTFLGAHAVPPEYRGRNGDYLDHLIAEVLPVVASEKLARFADAFCEKGYFSPEESARFLLAAARAGLRPKVHAEQLSRTGGARVAAELGAVSADHLDCADGDDLALLRRAGTIAVLAPGSNHFLGLPHYPPARRILAAGVPVALATDFNPGSCPCWNMQEIVSIACFRMRMTPEEALCAATINGAWAAGSGKTHGSLEPGKAADAILLDCEDFREIPYWFGANLVTAVYKAGALVHERR